MPIERVIRSSASGKVIPPGTGARVRVIYFDSKRPGLRADLTDKEVAEYLPWAEEVKTRPDRRRD